jgi:hypothetical protein
MRSDGSKPMGGDRCVYGWWAIDVTSPPVAFEIMRIRILNIGVAISFLVFLFLMMGKRVNL